MSDWARRKLHFIAIGGAGMSGLALVGNQLGATVTGSDRADSTYMERLRAAGMGTGGVPTRAKLPRKPVSKSAAPSSAAKPQPECVSSTATTRSCSKSWSTKCALTPPVRCIPCLASSSSAFGCSQARLAQCYLAPCQHSKATSDVMADQTS